MRLAPGLCFGHLIGLRQRQSTKFTINTTTHTDGTDHRNDYNQASAVMTLPTSVSFQESAHDRENLQRMSYTSFFALRIDKRREEF